MHCTAAGSRREPRSTQSCPPSSRSRVAREVQPPARAKSPACPCVKASQKAIRAACTGSPWAKKAENRAGTPPFAVRVPADEEGGHRQALEVLGVECGLLVSCAQPRVGLF